MEVFTRPGRVTRRVDHGTRRFCVEIMARAAYDLSRAAFGAAVRKTVFVVTFDPYIQMSIIIYPWNRNEISFIMKTFS